MSNASDNRIQLIGRLGKAPEIRTTQYGDRIATLSVATHTRWKDRNSGDYRERTEWHRVVVYPKALVDMVESKCRKATHVWIIGANETRKFQDKYGQDHYCTEVVVRRYHGTFKVLSGERNEYDQTTEFTGEGSAR